MGPREHIRAIVSGIDWSPETGTLPDPAKGRKSERHSRTIAKNVSEHLQRYVNEFAARHNVRDLDTNQMAAIARGLDGKTLEFAALKAETGHSPLAV